MKEINLKAIAPQGRKFARKEWEETGDLRAIMVWAGSQNNLAFLIDNIKLFRQHNAYEEALLDAYTVASVNLFNYSQDLLYYLFSRADKHRLRACGDPLPDEEIFTLYRGVSGRGRARRIRGLSWTASPHCASWFAQRFPDLLAPAVFTIECPRQPILAYLGPSFRNEEEYLILPWPDMEPKRIEPLPDKQVWIEQRGLTSEDT
jgi:hypothetical protein